MGVKISWLLKKKLSKYFTEDLCFKVFVKNQGWLCPYCEKLLPIKEKDAGFQEKAYRHFAGCASFKGIETPYAALPKLNKKKEALELLADIGQKVRSNASWKVLDSSGSWYCPYCVKPTEIKFVKGKTDADILTRDIIKHLRSCFNYSQHPKSFKSSEELKKIIITSNKERSLGQYVKKRIEEDDPLYLQKDPDGHWICPYCVKVVGRIAVSTEILLKMNAPPQIAYHLIYDCPKNIEENDPRPLSEIKALADQLLLAQKQRDKKRSQTSEDSEYISKLRAELNDLKTELETNEGLKQSLQKAQDVVMNMLPSSNPTPEGYEFATYFQSCTQVGGDFYDFIDLDSQKIGIAVGDVSGHGLEAALVMGMVKKALNMRALAINDPGEVITRTNEDVFPDLVRGTFVTCFYGIHDILDHSLKFVRAGHNYSILYRAESGMVEVLESGGMPLGVAMGSLFEEALGTVNIDFEKGDIFVQYTDGLTEGMNPDKEEYGEERFIDAIREHGTCDAESLLANVIKDANKFMAGHPQEDDISMLVIRRKPGK